MNLPELLLPVGNYQMCLAAIHNGADAVYVGMPGFNARGRTHDHEWGELQEIVEICRLYNVKVHLAFNILIFQDELSRAIEALDQAVLIGIDALIIQDLGLVKLIRSRYPELVIHGSTQMSLTNYEGIELLDDLNIKRFVLGRENSLSDIAQIKQNTQKELEVFVHGALCVAYSGQCFTSEAIGGRSANRGQCAQSCRFDYELFVDGKKKELLDQKYLVSPQDLCGINEIPQLKEIGVASFKVEGRLKSVEYVANAAKTYKAAIKKDNHDPVGEQDLANLAVSYSRGFYSGWLNGVAHQELAPGKYNSNRGQFLGIINLKASRDILIDTKLKLSLGDGLLFVTTDKGITQERGEKIYQLSKVGDLYKLKMGPKLNIKDLQNKEVEIYLTRSEELIKTVKKSIVDKNLQKKLPIKISMTGGIGTPLIFIASEGAVFAKVQSDSVLEEATGKKCDLDEMSKKITSLSHTPYQCLELDISLDENIFLHNRMFKELKQKLIAELTSKRMSRSIHAPHKIIIDGELINESKTSPVKLNLLFRKIEQIQDLLHVIEQNPEYKDFINYVILDFEFGKDYFSGIKILKENTIPCAIATTRILKPGEYHNFKTIERCHPDAILVRNLGALYYFKDKDFELMGDFSLNCSNSHTFNYLLSKGLNLQCSSYDLNSKQLGQLLKNIDASKMEITVHQYMPEFHMEHCVFAAYLSKGNSFKDCGKPCEKHEVHLKDMYGQRHEIKADQECRNTMFKSEAQSSLKYLKEWQKSGVSVFRFECLHEKGELLVSKLKTYFAVISGELKTEQAYKKLGNLESYGIGVGQIDKTTEYRARKK